MFLKSVRNLQYLSNRHLNCVNYIFKSCNKGDAEISHNNYEIHKHNLSTFRRSTRNEYKNNNGDSMKSINTNVLLANLFFWNIFKKKDDEDSPENKIIMTIKRSILCIQNKEFVKAEQMLHLALRMAQDLNSKEAITYIYDVMANLALEKGDYDKAEKLFANVMQRLFADGYLEDHIKMLHISSKIAHMADLSGHLDKAKQGFEWTLKKIEGKLNESEDLDLRELWGMTKNWYAQTLLRLNSLKEAKQCFLDAYTTYSKIHGKVNEEAIMMLNNLGVVCSSLGDIKEAEEFLKEAIKLSKELPEMVESGVFQANLGLIYLKQGLINQAKDECTYAWRWGRKVNNTDTVDQASHCLDEIKKWNAYK